MAKLAILGFGTVGSGVLEVLRRNREGIARRLGEQLDVKYILDIRDFSVHPDADLFVKNMDTILADDEVRVVVETIGGAIFAREFVTKALKSGRHVVTSNKELVSTHGAELLALAKANSCCFLFEASVGGGTPIITPMHQCLAANTISAVSGIVNGTTNFMLTAMKRKGKTFEEALKEAQDLGYAETIDPSSDVDGIDAQRKIAILASLSFGSHVYPQDISARGIRAITPADMQAAAHMGRAVKLVAWANKVGGTLAVGVEPVLVAEDNQLAGVEDVFNAVMVEGDMLGEVVFYGKGAGKLPTASAVVADAVDALKEGVRIHDSLFWQPAPPRGSLYPDEGTYTYYIRAAASPALLQTLPGAKPVNDAAVLVENCKPAQLEQQLAALEAKGLQRGAVLKLFG